MIFLSVTFTVFSANEAENVTTVVNFIDRVMNQKDYSYIDDYIHPAGYTSRIIDNEMYHEGAFFVPSQMDEHLKRNFHGTEENPHDVKWVILDMAADGDVVFTHLAIRGTLSNGTEIGWNAIVLYHLEEGRLVKETTASNSSYVTAQLTGKVETECEKIDKNISVHFNPPEAPQNESENAAMAVEFLKALENNRLEDVEELMHEDFKMLTSGINAPVLAFDELLEQSKTKRKQLGDKIRELNFMDLASDGDLVFTHTLAEDFTGTGEKYEHETIQMFTFKEGKIYSLNLYVDSEAFKTE